MNLKEQEVAIDELENRVDRLRVLYDQYFLGFEKLEPAIARKDVDRRFAILRKEQIRNTAQRFRFNVVTQKFNTYAMYWIRICRQIEEGTYKRHVKRAQERFGGANGGASAGAGSVPPPPRSELSIEVDLDDFDDVGDDKAELDALFAEVDASMDRLQERPPPAAEIPKPPPPSLLPERRSLLPSERAPRAAPLPAGATKPRVVLRKPGRPDPAPVAAPAPVPAPAAVPVAAAVPVPVAAAVPVPVPVPVAAAVPAPVPAPRRPHQPPVQAPPSNPRLRPRVVPPEPPSSSRLPIPSQVPRPKKDG